MMLLFFCYSGRKEYSIFRGGLLNLASFNVFRLPTYLVFSLFAVHHDSILQATTKLFRLYIVKVGAVETVYSFNALA